MKGTTCNWYLVLMTVLFLRACDASALMGFLDSIFGFGSSKMDVIHIANGIKSCPENQCRLALQVKNRPEVGILLNVLSPLDKLIMEYKEFNDTLNIEEQVEILEIYFRHAFPGKMKSISGKALDIIVTLLCQEKAYDLLNVALDKGILDSREVLIYFLKDRQSFREAVRNGLLDAIDVTQSIIAGKGVLHVLAESGELVLIDEILKKLNFKTEEYIKFSHFTGSEGDSVLHSAVLSDNADLVSLIARHFNRLCGKLNNYGMSPLRLALVNGSDFSIIKSLIDLGCFADGEVVLKENIPEPKFGNYFEIQSDLEKLSKWSSRSIGSFRTTLEQGSKLIDNTSSSGSNNIKSYYTLGLINSYRNFNMTLDRVLNVDLCGSPSIRSRSRSQSLILNRSSSTETALTGITKSPSLWSILSDPKFDENVTDFGETICVSTIIDRINFNFGSDDVKGRILKNLIKFESFDFTGCSLARFIQILINYSDPAVFALYVDRVIDYYFCIRSMFEQFKDYEKLIPFLDALGFNVNEPFRDGIYPIHWAVQSNNLNLVLFLIHRYGAALHVKSVYEHNNVLHYGLGDRISREMIDFLLSVVPELLMEENNFGCNPLQFALLRTDKFEIVGKILSVWQNGKRSVSFEYSEEVEGIFNEILSKWPRSPETENNSKDKFEILFKTCGSEEIARLLLSFIAKKLLKHFINEKTLSVLTTLKSFEEKSPGKVVINDSPVSINSLPISPKGYY